MNEKYSDLILEQYILDELPRDVKRRLADDLTHDAGLRARLDTLRASNQALVATHNQQELFREFTLRMALRAINKNRPTARPAPSSRWSRLAYALPIFAVATIALLIMKPSFIPETSEPLVVAEQEVRVKGLAPRINIYQQTENGIMLLNDNVAVSRGAKIQISYVAANARYGMIFSVDGRGAVTLHYPSDLHVNTDLIGKGEIGLNSSYELDDAPRFERFFFVSSERAFSAENIFNKVKQHVASNPADTASVIAVDPSLHWASQTLLKTER
jgi:hypothetical protein